MNRHDPDALRRARFVEWFEKHYGGRGGKTRFARDSGANGETAFSLGRVSQLMREDQPFGEDAALNIARRFGLRDDYFLRDEPAVESDVAGLSPRALAIAKRLDSLKDQPERLEWALRVCDLVAFAPPPKSPQEIFRALLAVYEGHQATLKRPRQKRTEPGRTP